MSDFDSAAARLARGETAEALAEFIAHWRITHSPHTANLIDSIASKAPDELQRTLATVVTPRVATSAENFEALRDVDDPRLSRFALDALANPPFCAPSALPFLLALAETVSRLRDSRLRGELAAIKATLHARLARKPMFVALAKRLDEIAAALPEDIGPTAAETKLLSSMKPARTAEELLAAVYENPDDDVPRQIYADFLLERGDPRGEFIALQLQRARDAAPSEREVELLKKHGKQWLGALAIVLRWGKSYAETKFERGFVSDADFIDHAEKKLRLIASDPSWATVERLRSWGTPDEFFARAPLHGLKEFSPNLDSESGQSLLARTDALNVKEASIRAPDIDLAPFKRVLPKLTTLKTWVATIELPLIEKFAQIEIPRMVVRSWFHRAESPLADALKTFEQIVQQVDGMAARADELELHGPFDRQHEAPVVIFRRDANGKLRVTS